MSNSGNHHQPIHLSDVCLQQVVDSAAARGEQTVRIPPGRYQMADSLRLRPNMHLWAEGDVILEKLPTVSSRMLDIVGYGHSEFRVAEPHLFQPGMGVAIASDRSGGFGTTVARIVEQDGDTFFIDTPCHRDYRPREGATVSSLYPIIAGYGVANVRVSGLILEGPEPHTGHLDGCRGGGVFLLGCQDIQLADLEIRAYPGDAISFQQCVDLWIAGCHLHDNAGHGLHPGSGSVRYVIERNRIQRNGQCGIYYCLRTTHSICRDNRIETNGAEGITIGERDTDHLLEGNIIRDNAKAGLALRAPQVEGPDRLIVSGNQFSGNQRTQSGFEVEIGPRLRDVHLLDNDVDAENAIRVAEDCQGIVLHGNTRAGAALPASSIQANSPILPAAPAQSLHVGPAALPLTGARHLRIQRIAPWQDRTPDTDAMGHPVTTGQSILANVAAGD